MKTIRFLFRLCDLVSSMSWLNRNSEFRERNSLICVNRRSSCQWCHHAILQRSEGWRFVPNLTSPWQRYIADKQRSRHLETSYYHIICPTSFKKKCDDEKKEIFIIFLFRKYLTARKHDVFQQLFTNEYLL